MIRLRHGQEVMTYGRKISTEQVAGAAYAPLMERSYSGIDVWPAMADLPDAQPTALVFEAAKLLLAEPFERAALRVLELVGRTLQVERAWTVEYNDSLSTFRDTNEWCLDGVATYNVDNLDIPNTALGAMHGLMRDGHPVAIYDVAAMPRSMRALQTKIQLQDTLSSVGVPIHYAGQLRGIVGIDLTSSRRRWSAIEIRQLCDVAELIGYARYGFRDGRAHGQAFMTPPQEGYVYLQASRGIVGTTIGDIAVCAAEGDNTRIFLRGGDEVLDNRSLKWWEGVLPESLFMRVHRSVLLRLGAVRTLQRRKTGQWTAYVDGHDEPVSVSRAKVTVLRNRLGY